MQRCKNLYSQRQQQLQHAAVLHAEYARSHVADIVSMAQV